jgi:hypothetical protein
MTDKTLAELQADRDAADLAIATHDLTHISAAAAALADPAVAGLLATLRALLPEVSAGPAHKQIGNVVTVLDYVPGFIAEEAARLDALVNPPVE